MSEKRVARRSVSFKMAMICIILAVGVIGAIAYYRIVLNDKNTTDDSNASTHACSGSQYDPYAGDYFHWIHTDIKPGGDYKEP